MVTYRRGLWVSRCFRVSSPGVGAWCSGCCLLLAAPISSVISSVIRSVISAAISSSMSGVRTRPPRTNGRREPTCCQAVTDAERWYRPRGNRRFRGPRTGTERHLHLLRSGPPRIIQIHLNGAFEGQRLSPFPSLSLSLSRLPWKPNVSLEL